MASYNFSSLADILKNQSPPQPKNTTSQTSKTNTTKPTKVPHENPYVTEMFGELYFKESPSSTPHLLFPSSSSPNSSPERNFDTREEEEKRNGLIKNNSNGGEKNLCLYFNKSLTTKGKLFPPPISYLKMFKTGKLFVYLKFDEKKGMFVREEVRVLPQGIMRASRENGCLKLNLVDGESEEDEESVDQEEREDGGWKEEEQERFNP